MSPLTQAPSLSVPAIRWRPTAALASVHGSITLSWIIYRVHLAPLLTQAGFPASFAPFLLLIETILAIGVEPWAGSTSDRTLRYLGGRFYVILIGTALTALLFVCLPGLVNLLPQNSAANWWFPGLLIVWGIAISMFRSPALALLGSYASSKQLPAAASVVTLAGALAGSATPLASPWLLSLGVTPTFIGAALLLLASVGWLKSAQPTEPIEPVSRLEFFVPTRLATWLRIIGLGLSVTLAFRLAVDLFPKILKAATIQPPLVMGCLFISMAMGAILAGRLTTRWTNFQVMCLGLGLTAVFLILMLWVSHPVVAFLVAGALGGSFGLVFNGTLPFVLSHTSFHQAGLGVGCFFAGAATATSLQSGLLLYSGFLSQPGILSPQAGVGLGILALLLAGACLSSPARGSAPRTIDRES